MFLSKENNGLAIPELVAPSTPATLGSTTSHCSENRRKIGQKAHMIYVFAINRVMLMLLRTRDCSNNSCDIAGKPAFIWKSYPLRLRDKLVSGRVPSFMGRLFTKAAGFWKFGLWDWIRLQNRPIFHLLSCIIFRLSFSLITDCHRLPCTGWISARLQPFLYLEGNAQLLTKQITFIRNNLQFYLKIERCRNPNNVRFFTVLVL